MSEEETCASRLSCLGAVAVEQWLELVLAKLVTLVPNSHVTPHCVSLLPQLVLLSIYLR